MPCSFSGACTNVFADLAGHKQGSPHEEDCKNKHDERCFEKDSHKVARANMHCEEKYLVFRLQQQPLSSLLLLFSSFLPSPIGARDERVNVVVHPVSTIATYAFVF